MKNNKRASRPSIYLIDSEADRLADLALAVANRTPDVSSLLLGEIERARIVPSARIPDDVVAMHSEVEFIDEGSNAQRRVQIVYPQEADVSEGRISVLTHAGAGLIGLRAGDSIDWPDRDGRTRKIKIIAVKQAAVGEIAHE